MRFFISSQESYGRVVENSLHKAEFVSGAISQVIIIIS